MSAREDGRGPRRHRLAASRLAIAVAVAAGASLLFGGFVVAAKPRSPGLIRSCYNRHSGALRVRTRARCRHGEKSIVWNRQGRPGPRGLAGTTGMQGAQGVPGPLASLLPSGKTLRGYFSVNAEAKGDPAYAQISFAFPLTAPANVEVENSDLPGATTPECPGSENDPEASGGHLCVYYTDASNLASLTPGNTNRFGTTLIAAPANPAGSPVSTFGSWAVTAP